MPTRPKRPISDTDVPVERSNFHAYLAVNPNYFGSLPDLGFPVELVKQGDTAFEQLDCVSYSPERSRLEATFDIKRSFGYSGGLCSTGSFEHVRFFVSYDEGVDWTDVGLASVNVHDIAAGTVCDKTPYPPLSYTVGVNFSPRRNWCGIPVLPLVRAILSWEIVPDPTKPNQPPIWGNVHDCHVQIPPRRFVVDDVLSQLAADVKLNLPPYVLQQPIVPVPPVPDPGPIAPLALPELAKLYAGKAKDAVPAHRFALPHLESAAVEGAKTLESYVYPAQLASSSKIDLSAVLKQLEQLNGDTTYEELECLGLDNNTDQLVGTFRVKRPNGFSGGPCTAGSTEYVAYWADFGDDCTYTYLGTAKVTTHDYAKLPAGGLCYAAPLSVDLGAFRKPCGTPVIGRVRAVLSWGTPPSTTDPHKVPYWGNILDARVQLRPGRPYDGNARFTIVGGVEAARVGFGSGLTLPGATIVENGTLLPSSCPFGGLVSWHGPLDPALAGSFYRIRVRNVTASGPTTDLGDAFHVVDQFGFGSNVTPGGFGPGAAYTPWPQWQTNTTGMLGFFTPGGDDLWEVSLEVLGIGVVDVKRVQMDNTLNGFVTLSDLDDAADLHLDTLGACRLPRGPLHGTFVARDKHFLSWNLVVVGGPGGPMPPTPLSVGILQSTQTSVAGEPFTIDLSLLQPCGYVVRLEVSDRAVINSASVGRTTYVERGVCLE